jgi:hypothetical protein
VHIRRELTLEAHPECEQHDDRNRPPDDPENRQKGSQLLSSKVKDELGQDVSKMRQL